MGGVINMFEFNEKCYFLFNNECSALIEFYNYPNKNVCEGCPFFKTEQQFKKGFDKTYGQYAFN